MSSTLRQNKHKFHKVYKSHVNWVTKLFLLLHNFLHQNVTLDKNLLLYFPKYSPTELGKQMYFLKHNHFKTPRKKNHHALF